MFVLIIISDLDLTDMCPHFTELPNKTPSTSAQQSLNHTDKIGTDNKFHSNLPEIT